MAVNSMVCILQNFLASFIFNYRMPAYEVPGAVPVNEGRIGNSERGGAG